MMKMAGEHLAGFITSQWPRVVGTGPVIVLAGLAAAMLSGMTAMASGISVQGGSMPESTEMAIFAGGCFWCMQHPYDDEDGVIATTVGYIGGYKKNPTYREVSAGGTGHAEAIRIVYDPQKVSYTRLLDIFWHNIDPLTANGQFCDHGKQYRSAIFYLNDEQRQLAEASRQALEESGRFATPVVTEITAAGEFYPAEEYHQDYYRKNPIRYKFYRSTCGRDRRLHELWGNEAGHE